MILMKREEIRFLLFFKTHIKLYHTNANCVLLLSNYVHMCIELKRLTGQEKQSLTYSSWESKSCKCGGAWKKLRTSVADSSCCQTKGIAICSCAGVNRNGGAGLLSSPLLQQVFVRWEKCILVSEKFVVWEQQKEQINVQELLHELHLIDSSNPVKRCFYWKMGVKAIHFLHILMHFITEYLCSRSRSTG